MAFISSKLHSGPHNIKRDKGCHFAVPSSDTAVMKIYLPNNIVSEYIKLKMLGMKWGIYTNIFWETVHTSLILGRKHRQGHRQV